MRNAGLDEAQAGIKITGRNINNLRYADDEEGNGNPLQYSCLENAMLGEAQAGIKITGRNINNLKYTYDTTFMAEVKRN